jgi:AcrR family transcriptional regulator
LDAKDGEHMGLSEKLAKIDPCRLISTRKTAKTPQAELTKTESSEVARHIARVAAKLFAERGYDATSVREIVEAAGVAKPTLYYYFRSKEGLAHAIVTLPLNTLVNTTRQIVTTVVDPITCLEAVIEAHYAFCRDDPERTRFIYALLFGPLGSEIAADIEPCKGDLAGWFEASVRRLAEGGIIARDRMDACLLTCRGLVVTSTLSFLYHDQPLGSDLARRQVADVLDGFRIHI